MVHLPNVGLMLGQRLRRWPNIKPALAQYIVLANMDRHFHTAMTEGLRHDQKIF